MSNVYAESLRAYTAAVIAYGVTLGAADGSGFVGEYTQEIQMYARKAREAATAMARLEMGTPSMAVWLEEAAFWAGKMKEKP